MEKIAYIPFKDIRKIEIYINSQKLALSEIVKQTGCDYAITGNFYNNLWKPVCPLKKDNTVLYSSTDTYRGFKWNNPSDFSTARIPNETTNYKNHFACVALIANGTAYPDNLIQYKADVGGKRGRTGIGTKGNCLVLYASKDGTSDAKTPEKLRDYMFAKGVTEFIMGDGGGKVNYYGDGELMQGSAKSQNLILVYLNKEETKPTNPTTTTPNTYTINQAPITNNPRYKANQKKAKIGYMQHSTGTPGGKAESFIKAWNSQSAKAETEFIIDDTGIYQMMPVGIRTWHCGGSGNNTLVGCEVCEPLNARMLDVNWRTLKQGGKDNTTYAVTMLQKELQAWGYDPNGIDGIFGGGTKTAVIAFQKAVGLPADGVVGLNTLHALQRRTRSYMAYNVNENQAYFEDIYRKAVFTCAYVLKQLGVSKIDKNSLCSHAEGYMMGIASNHADVGHWWPKHGKSMDDFRADVKTYMETGKLPYSVEVEDKPVELDPPAKSEMDIAWDKACDMGILDGSNPTGNVTRRQLAVVLDRLDLLK